MRVEALGYAAVKGTRHLARASLDVAGSGVVGDRRWCLVDVQRDEVLRTVRHPRLLALRADVRETAAGPALRLSAPGLDPAVAVPAPSGERITCDYWGHAVPLALQDGPHAALASAWLGRAVRLAEAPPGGVVYGGAVSLVAGASADALSVPAARFRPNVVVAGADAFAEGAWVGCDVELGEAVVRPRTRTPRCALVESDPVTGGRDTGLLGALPQRSDCLGRPAPVLGVDGDVVVPGRVRVGDAVRVRRDAAGGAAP